MTRAALLFALVALLLGCNSPCPDGYHEDYLAETFTYTWQSSSAVKCAKNEPLFTGQAVSPSSGRCASEPDDDPCVACVRASCCSEALACSADSTCTARVQCAFTDAGCSAGPDATYDATAACLSAHCPACGRLP